MKIQFCLLFAFILLACNGKSDKRVQSADKITDTVEKVNHEPAIFPADTLIALEALTIVLPKGWRLANDDTLMRMTNSTAEARFHNKNGKLVRLQYGLGTFGNPAEPGVVSAYFRKGYIKFNADTSGIMFTDDPRLRAIRGKSNYHFSQGRVSELPATFFRPKRIGTGYTGVYVDSIGEIAGNIADLVLYAEHLDSIENAELERVLRTLVIKGIN
jgi:hypothetical protein